MRTNFFIGGMFVFLGIAIHKFKWHFLISGYNTKSKEKKVQGAINFITNNRDWQGNPVAADDQFVKVTLLQSDSSILPMINWPTNIYHCFFLDIKNRCCWMKQAVTGFCC